MFLLKMKQILRYPSKSYIGEMALAMVMVTSAIMFSVVMLLSSSNLNFIKGGRGE